MIKAELFSLLSRKLRTILTMVAIVLGVAMISGTYVLTDTINASFNQIFQQATAHIDAVVTGKALISSEFSPNPPLPARLLPIVERATGVSSAAGEIADTADLYSLSTLKNGKVLRTKIGSVGGAPSLLFGVSNERFNELSLLAGHWPAGNQIAVDETTMSRQHLRIGQTVFVAVSGQKSGNFTIVGETRFGSVGSVGGATLIDMDLRTAQVMTGKANEYDQIAVTSIRGVTEKQVARNIRTAIPPSLKRVVRVRTAHEQASNSASQIGTALNFITIALLAFAGVAVFVGAFIIFNTFSITVAQRAREFALFRTLGATRGQIMRSVVVEAGLIGLISAVVGLLAGLGIARGLNALFQSFGVDLPSSGLILQARTVIVAILVGTLVTLLAACVPAFRATRVAPVAALREGATLPKGRLSRLMPLLSGAVGILGLLLTVAGIFASFHSGGTRLIVIGAGCLLLFLGVSMSSPRLVKPLASVVGWPMERFSRVTGRLARDNAMRNPSRTATTAAALMIGLALVGFVTIFAAELKKTADDAVSREVAGTFIVEDSSSNQNAVQPLAMRQIAKVSGVSVTSPVSEDLAVISGIGRQRVDGISPSTFGAVYRFQWKAGSSSTLRSLGTHGALIADSFASSHHLKVGSAIRLMTTKGIHDTFSVRGIYKSSQLLASIVIPISTWRTDWQQNNAIVDVVNIRPGANQQLVENRITNLLDNRFPSLSVSSQAQFKAQQDAQINGLLDFIYVLLGLSIVVSLFGIINTLVLSIYERTREIGMLRAIGTTRSQVRWMIRWESVITSLIGAILGLALGILLAILITAGLQNQGIEFAFPISQLLIFVILAIVFGIVAAAFPARRAARLDILQAVAYE